MQNNFKLGKIVSVVVVLLVIVGIWYFTNSKKEEQVVVEKEEQIEVEINIPAEHFFGTITGREDGCVTDAWCLFEINHAHWVAYNEGMLAPVIGPDQLSPDLAIGDDVEVWAKKSIEKWNNNESTYTIVGDPELFIRKLEENQHVAIQKDLNGDGIVENISIEIVSGLDHWNNKSILKVNNTVFIPEFEENPAPYFGIVDINTKDNTKEVVMLDQGPSDDPVTTFLAWNGSKLTNYGSIPSMYNFMKFDGNGKITTRTRGKILQTWFHDSDYILSGGKIVSITREFYRISYEQELIMLKDFSFFKSPKDKTIIFTAKKGDKVEMIGCDDVSLCMIKNASGVEGWFSVEDYGIVGDEKLSASDIFEGLSYAD